MSKSYNDPVKTISRDKQRDFIARHLSYKKSRDIRVLCLPGAEQEGEEALEVREVYDPLGIPRSNITGLEIDKQIYERLQKASLGIKLVNSSDIKYLEKARREYGTWDIISLDYTSFFTPDSQYAISLIANDGLLGKHGILVTNFMAAREHNASQELLKDLYIAFNSGSALSISDSLKLEDKARGDFELSNDRSDTVKQSIQNIMANGNSALSTQFYSKFDNFRKILDELKVLPEITHLTEKIIKGRNIDEKLAQTYFVRTYMKKMYYNSFLASSSDLLIPNLYWMMSVRPYFPKAVESYSYISNTKTPMLFDIGFYDKNERELRQFENFFTLRGNSLNYNPFELNENRAEMKTQMAIETTQKLHFMFWEAMETTDRVFLGSSYVPKSKDHREKISKEEAIELLKAGFPPAEIAEVYRGFTKMQLAAFKAHLAMGTYKTEEVIQDFTT